MKIFIKGFVVPEDFEVPKPLWRKEFEGGLFAALPTNMSVIGERWKQLWEWTQNTNKYAFDWDPSRDRWGLEECIDYKNFNSDEVDFSEKQLDLLIPIKRMD